MFKRCETQEEAHIWFFVETPAISREHKLPADESDWTRADKRKFREIVYLAEDHGTHVQNSAYRRG
jgi:hypothetical protein